MVCGSWHCRLHIVSSIDTIDASGGASARGGVAHSIVFQGLESLILKIEYMTLIAVVYADSI